MQFFNGLTPVLTPPFHDFSPCFSSLSTRGKLRYGEKQGFKRECDKTDIKLVRETLY